MLATVELLAESGLDRGDGDGAGDGIRLDGLRGGACGDVGATELAHIVDIALVLDIAVDLEEKREGREGGIGDINEVGDSGRTLTSGDGLVTQECFLDGIIYVGHLKFAGKAVVLGLVEEHAVVSEEVIGIALIFEGQGDGTGPRDRGSPGCTTGALGVERIMYVGKAVLNLVGHCQSPI